ncbi:PREDICTED: olfactory receptor 11A1-like [Elephantulus edwardii]|uniref:olfactory receptor 11A1-like n=1 Tax=Elephantulus edwardii TaxID=28737 RepID=UPI0003F073AE|nr:PREDICTED: olfactory receptor 11A1-like [Elephantulus edwardii]
MEDNQRRNISTITYVTLQGFGDLEEVWGILFSLFLSFYVATLCGNFLLILAVQTSTHLHTPMYFFLCHLSCVDVGYTSSITPQLLKEILSGGVTISFSACVMQLYVVGALLTVECFLLAIMSYDRYLAICWPLRYPLLMDSSTCIKLAVGSWISGFLFVGAVLIFLATLTFCGPHIIDDFFCDLFPLVKLSCTDTTMVEKVAFASSFLSLSPFLWTLLSYGCILSSILRISTSTGRYRAFSTCSSHLIVVSVFYGTMIVVYMTPPSRTTLNLNKISSLLYTVLTPLLNPLVYSLRNKDVQIALKKGVKLLFVKATRIVTKCAV